MSTSSTNILAQAPFCQDVDFVGVDTTAWAIEVRTQTSYLFRVKHVSSGTCILSLSSQSSVLVLDSNYYLSECVFVQSHNIPWY